VFQFFVFDLLLCEVMQSYVELMVFFVKQDESSFRKKLRKKKKDIHGFMFYK